MLFLTTTAHLDVTMRRRFLQQLILIFLCALALDVFLQFQMARQYRNDQVLDVSLRLSTLRARIEKEIVSNLLLVQGTANFISVTPDMTQELYAQYASGVAAGKNLPKNVGAAPD